MLHRGGAGSHLPNVTLLKVVFKIQYRPFCVVLVKKFSGVEMGNERKCNICYIFFNPSLRAVADTFYIHCEGLSDTHWSLTFLSRSRFSYPVPSGRWTDPKKCPGQFNGTLAERQIRLFTFCFVNNTTVGARSIRRHIDSFRAAITSCLYLGKE